MIPTAVFVIAVGLHTTVAAVVDLRIHRIPNYLTVPAAVLGIAYHTFSPAGLGMLGGVAGFAVGFVLLLLPGLIGGGGMGDIIDACIANDRWLRAGTRGSGLPLEALRSLAMQGSINCLPPWGPGWARQ